MPLDGYVDSTIAEVVTTLSRRLQDESRRRRAPRGFDGAVARVAASRNKFTDDPTSRNLESEQTEQVFLDAGLQAFLAYQLASGGYGCHHKGQHKEKQAIHIIKELPRAQQQSIADQVAKADTHPNIQRLLKRLSEHPSKRRRLNDSDGSSSSETSEPESDTDQNQSSPPDLRPLVHDNMLVDSHVQVGSHSTSGIDSSTILTETANDLTASDATQEVTSPPAKNLLKVFPYHICRAIRKIGDKAAIVIAFPYIRNSKSFCLMTLSIQANKVAHFAMVLFGIHIECEDDSRYMVVDGVRVQAKDLFIQGVKWELVLPFLGLDCSDGVERCPERKKEVEGGEERTACVTMRITDRANEDALLSLSIALESGHKVKEVLFGE